MLNLTDSQKESFYKSGAYFNDYKFYFPDLDYTITNETLHQESVTIKESICDSEDLQLGGCIASSCEFEVSELAEKELAGLEFTARLLVNDGKDAVVQMGKYRVDSAKRVDDKDYRKITAYDALYDAQIDVSEWYNKVFYVVSQYEELVAVGEIDDLWEHGDYTIDNSGSKPPDIFFFANGAVPEEAHDTTYLDTSTGKLYEAQDINKDDDSKDELYRWVEVYQCTRKTKTVTIYATTTLKEMRENLLQYLNIPYIKQDLLNDNIKITRTLDASENGQIIGTDMLKYICELNAGFGKINRNGQFEVIELSNVGLYPEETLYPSEDLYPEESNYELLDNNDSSASYISTTYEEYMTEPITGVIIKSDSDNVGELIGTKDNAYMISGNPLVYSKTSDELKKIGENIYGKIKDLSYRPNTTVSEGLPYLETGDYFILSKENGDIYSPMLTRTLTGVQGLKDTFEIKGNKLRANEETESSEIMSLQSKTTKIQKSVDGLLIEVTDLDENTSSRFEQTASKIEAEVTRAQGKETELSGRITLTAEQFSTELSNLSNSTDSKFTQTSNSINAEVTRATNEENSLSSRISITENGISQKVSKGDVCSEINQSSEQITLNSNRLVISSSNFSLDNSGSVSMKGKVEATSGSVGPFSITSSGLEWASGGTKIWSNVIFTEYIEPTYSNKHVALGGLSWSNRGKVDIYSSDGGIYINDTYFNPNNAIELNSSKMSVTYSSAGNVKIENCGGFVSEGSSGYGNLATVGYVKSKVSSDERIKKNIIEIPDIEDVYMDIPIYQFEYNGITERDGICFGTTAQAIEKAFANHDLDIEDYNIVDRRMPSVFNGEYKHIPANDELHYINWENLNGMSIYMIQKLVKEVEKLKQEVVGLKQKFGGN